MRRTLLLFVGFMMALMVNAESWDYITTSDEYYWGVGIAETLEEAERGALADMISKIATHVSSDFNQIDDVTTTNGSVEHRSRVLNVVNTYSQATLTNLQRFPTEKRGKDFQARCYIKCSELYKIYESRKERARNMAERGDEYLEKGKIDMAMESYYHAYSLVRSLQFPNEAKAANGRMLIDELPAKIKEVLNGITVEYDSRDGEFVDLLFYYEGKPVSSVDFTYNDGRSNDCNGQARDGRGMLEMIPGYDTDTYHVNIEYEYKNQTLGDPELESVLQVITKKVFPRSEIAVSTRKNMKVAEKKPAKKQTPVAEMADNNYNVTTSGRMSMPEVGVNLTPSETQKPADNDECVAMMERIVKAIKNRNVSTVEDMFTVDGLDVYKRLLLRYGTPRIIGTPNFSCFKGLNNTVSVRGMQMSFSFNDAKKASFVEDLVFTFDSDRKICNVAFGLGQKASSDILSCQTAWPDDAKELLMEFMENYKTAYCLKRIDYIRDIFADDATIIVGRVLRKSQAPTSIGNTRITQEGEQTIRYNRYTKDTYLEHLRKCFNNPRNPYINIRFGKNEVQWLEKFASSDQHKNREIYAIQINQEYSSTTYSDKGYLFLMIDMTNHDEPLIKVRTWQPNEEDMEKLYNAGWFYNF